ncbi:acyltransferase family protein [Pseudoxanthomonas winnipegensis]|nr:acyltransferase [Pseudoxanthomonas winnipegensis]
MQRRHDIDWVRVLAFGLLVFYHVGMYYVTWGYHVKSAYASATLEPLMLLSSPWRMSLLFVISGVATAFLLQRRPRGFFAQRSWRLLVPLIFGMLVVVPPQSYYQVVEQLPGGYHASYLQFYTRYLSGYHGFCGRDGGCLALPTWNHLWFLVYVWVYTLVLWLAWRLLPAAFWRRLRAVTARACSGWGVLGWPVLLLAVARLALVDRFDQTHALVDDWYNHAQYLPMFLLGFLLAFADGFWEGVHRRPWIALTVAAVGYALMVKVWYFSGYDDAHPIPQALRPGAARGLGGESVVRDRRGVRVRLAAARRRQRGAALPGASGVPGLHPAPDHPGGAGARCQAVEPAAAAGRPATGAADLCAVLRRLRSHPSRAPAASAVRA